MSGDEKRKATEGNEVTESQFPPFMDEILDYDALESHQSVAGEAPSGPPSYNDAPMTKYEPVANLNDIAMVRRAIDFDERAFRADCQALQAEMAQEFKGLISQIDNYPTLEMVDKLYDALDNVVAELSKYHSIRHKQR